MNYLEDIYILSHIKRYSTVHTIREESVAEHSFNVAAILFHLHDHYRFDLGEAIQMAIAHDMPEMELNDVPRLIKDKYPAIKEAFKVCEHDVIEKLPPSVRSCIKSYHAMDTVEAAMVKFADVIQCEQFARTEVNLGNEGYMREVLEASSARVAQYELELKEYER